MDCLLYYVLKRYVHLYIFLAFQESGHIMHLKNRAGHSIAQLVFGIPAISGIEFGSGFSASEMIGSQYSDRFYTDERGRTRSKTNSHGGFLGGVSTGMPIIINASVQPLNNNYMGLNKKTCFVPEAAVCVEAAVNIALLSNMIDYPNFCLR